ncbi:MAG: hypothetical protein V1809_14950 [Planctomycetota bacterium]
MSETLSIGLDLGKSESRFTVPLTRRQEVGRGGISERRINRTLMRSVPRDRFPNPATPYDAYLPVFPRDEHNGR